MTNLNFLEKELRLRKLYIKLAKKKDYEQNIFSPELHRLIGRCSKISLNEIKSLWGGYIERIKHVDNYMCLVLSIPFCRSRCEYCSHYRWTDRGESGLENYVQLLVKEMRSFNDIFKDIKFKFLQTMGGTPSRLTEKQLKDILAEIHGNFTIEKQAVQCFDFNPHDSSPEKMKILADFGFNRISFGVQSLDQDVLRAANRGYQNYDTIKKAVKDARTFPSLERINVELLIGLRNDTPQTVLETFVKLAELKIDLIRVYRLSPLPSYVKKFYNNSKDLFEQQLAGKLRIFEKIIAPVAEDLGYRFISEDYPDQENFSYDFLLKKHDPSIRRKYNFKKGGLPIDCLGIGVDSWSRISNILYYENGGFLSSYSEKDALGILYKGVFLSEQRDKYSHVMTRLEKINAVSISEYKNMFSADIREDFKEALAKLRRIGAVTITEDVISLTAKTMEERFAHLLFFVDNKTILAELGKTISDA